MPAFGAIATLKNKRVSGCRLSQLVSQSVDLPGRDQWRKLSKGAQSFVDLLLVIVDGLLLCKP